MSLDKTPDLPPLREPRREELSDSERIDQTIRVLSAVRGELKSVSVQVASLNGHIATEISALTTSITTLSSRIRTLESHRQDEERDNEIHQAKREAKREGRDEGYIQAAQDIAARLGINTEDVLAMRQSDTLVPRARDHGPSIPTNPGTATPLSEKKPHWVIQAVGTFFSNTISLAGTEGGKRLIVGAVALGLGQDAIITLGKIIEKIDPTPAQVVSVEVGNPDTDADADVDITESDADTDADGGPR